MTANKNIKESGFSLLEMMIAMTILAIGLLGVAALQITAINGSAYSMKYNQATVHVSDQFEALKNAPYDHIESGEKKVGGYTIKTTVAPGPASNTKSVLIEATWKDSTAGAKGKDHKISYNTCIWKKPVATSP